MCRAAPGPGWRGGRADRRPESRLPLSRLRPRRREVSQCEPGRRTGFAPFSISRWLKIDRCPTPSIVAQPSRSRCRWKSSAKLLADASETALAELIPLTAEQLAQVDTGIQDVLPNIAPLRQPLGD